MIKIKMMTTSRINKTLGHNKAAISRGMISKVLPRLTLNKANKAPNNNKVANSLELSRGPNNRVASKVSLANKA
jgi:hypothetical protein